MRGFVFICFIVFLFSGCYLPLDANWEDTPLYDYIIQKHGYNYFGDSLDSICLWVNTNIEYRFDKSDGHLDYWSTPNDTLHKMQGDCDDKAILFAFIVYKRLGIKVDFSIQDRHLACFYHGKYYDPTNSTCHTDFPIRNEVFKSSFDDIMSKCGLCIL